jgi:hypothetical protein
MRVFGAAFLLGLCSLWAQPSQTANKVALNKPAAPSIQFRIAPQTFRDLEKRFDRQLATLVPDANNPVDVLGTTRGVYVEGCGVVFTAEVSLVTTPELMPFRLEIPKELAERVHKNRVERLPLLRKAMDEMLDAMARTFVTMPGDQKVVLAVRLLYGSWESTVGMPAQVMMSATRAGVQAGEIKWDVQ